MTIKNISFRKNIIYYEINCRHTQMFLTKIDDFS